jgi:Pyridoxamine 5'-phosphate oxidase
VASWGEVSQTAPELAAAAQEAFDAGKHKTIATLRRDGSPRISGIEAWFWDGELWFGSMWQAVKALDLKRDPRFALHSASDGSPDWKADAKVAGRVDLIEEADRIAAVLGGSGQPAPPGPMHLFRADLDEVVHTHLNEERTQLVIDSWSPGAGLRSRRR